MTTVKLIAQDKQEFTVNVESIKMSGFIKKIIEEQGSDLPITLPSINSLILGKVISYCQYHFDHPNPVPTNDIINWDIEYLNTELETLYELIEVADYLDIKNLLDLTCEKFADLIRGKSPADVRKFFHLINDLTPEEETRILTENLSF